MAKVKLDMKLIMGSSPTSIQQPRAMASMALQSPLPILYTASSEYLLSHLTSCVDPEVPLLTVAVVLAVRPLMVVGLVLHPLVNLHQKNMIGGTHKIIEGIQEFYSNKTCFPLGLF